MSIEVGIIMGSRSDWETMQHASETLNALGAHHDLRVRTFLHRLIDQTALDRVRNENVLHVGGGLAEQ